MRKWVEQPLMNVRQISRRQGAVEELYNSFMLREECSDLLKGVLDLNQCIDAFTKVIVGANADTGQDRRAQSCGLLQPGALQRLAQDVSAH